MTPISAPPAAAREHAPGKPSGVRRGRHRRPRPRGALLAAGALALAAGVLSLVRVAPDPGVATPGTAEAGPRPGPGGGVPDRSARTVAGVAATPTGLPSATSVMGGRGLAGTPSAIGSGSPVTAAPGTATAPAGGTAEPTTGSTGVPTTVSTGVPTSGPTGVPGPHRTTGRPSPTASATASPTPSPPPSHRPPKHGPGEICLPVIRLCVDTSG
ncbi:hypothetical protein ACF1BE_10615 [Streptomyces sp. NPDC014991]|uniref:hypothetical protein n=1 Tax=Streptomyces sp. NPDC014991 TaxID=3364935 RepID=UPI0036F50717